MRIRHALALAAVAVGLTACGTPTVTSTPDTAAQEAAISKPSDAPSTETAPSSAPKQAKIGDVITLKDNTGDRQVAVKLNRVITSGAAANEIAKPGAGQRFYGVEVILKNSSSETFTDSPGSGGKVIDAEGQEYEKALFGEIAGEHNLGEVTMTPGAVRKGVIVFEVPAKAKIVEFQMALSSGVADQKGLWATKK